MSQVNLSINLSAIASVGNLLITLEGSSGSGNGFESLTFQIFKESSLIENDLFTNLSAATAFFSNRTLDFGLARSGVTGDLDLRLSSG